jgi:hypothetical protein
VLEITWVGFYGVIGVTCWVIRIRVYIGYFLIMGDRCHSVNHVLGL